MPRILVAGLVNLETTLRVDAFPVAWQPVSYPFFGIGAAAAGVGFNVSKALTVLGNEVDLLSLAANDAAGALVRSALAAIPIAGGNVENRLAQTCQSIILYDAAGTRQTFTDLKDIQDSSYPAQRFNAALAVVDGCVLCNINFARPFLEIARAAGKPIATDVHAVTELADPYNADFMQAADILFMSHEQLPTTAAEWARAVMACYAPQILVIGMGAGGALLAERGKEEFTHLPAVSLRPIVSTVGAGDALFACFVDGYWRGLPARRALARAMRFAAWKIGVASASDGYLAPVDLD